MGCPPARCRNQGRKKHGGLGFGFHCRSVAGPLTHGGLPACRPPPHPPHLVGLPLFSSSSSAIVTTGAPEPACDSIEMPDGACNARSPWGMVQRSHCLEPTWILPASFPLPSRSAPVRLFPRFSLAPRRMPPSTGRRGQAGPRLPSHRDGRPSFDSQSRSSEPHTLSSARITRSHHLCFASTHRIALGDRWTCEARPIAVGRR